MSSAKSLLTVLGVLAALCMVSVSATNSASGADSKREVRILFAGDILLSRGVERRLEQNPQALAHALRSILSGSDLAVGNLEGAVGSEEACLEWGGQVPCFPVRGDFIPLLRAAGFYAIGLANNHSSDLGPAARQATGALLAKSGLTPLTFEYSPQFFRVNDITVGMVSLSLAQGHGERAVDIHGIDIRQKLRMAKNLSNVVVVYVHWGSEFLDWPDRKQRQAADRLVGYGADIIIGHHPHVIQKPENLHGKPVFYSLGNLVFDQKYPSTREGMLADCRISRETVSCSGLLTQTSASGTLPVVKGYDSGKTLSECVLKLSPPLIVNGIVLRPENTPAGESSSGLALEAVHKGKILWKTRRANVVSMEPMKVGGPQGSEYLLTLERHFSPMDGEEGLRPCVYDVRPEGLVPKWRGTALAWPLLDAVVPPGDEGVICAQHRGDSFLVPGDSNGKRIAAYRWKGFGFSGISDPEAVGCSDEYFSQIQEKR